MDRAYKELWISFFIAYLFSNHFKDLLAFFSREQTENSFETNANTFSRIIHCPKMKMNEKKKTESVPISIPRADNVWEIRGRFFSSKIPKCEKRFIQQNLFVRVVVLFKSQWYFRMVRSFLVESKSKHISHVHLVLAEPTLVCPQLWSCMKYLCCQSNWSIFNLVWIELFIFWNKDPASFDQL